MRKKFSLPLACLSFLVLGQTLPSFAQDAPKPSDLPPVPPQRPRQIPPPPGALPVQPVPKPQTPAPVNAPGPVVIGTGLPNIPDAKAIPIAAPPVRPTGSTMVPTNILAWDAEKKVYDAQPTEANAHFTFYLTNVSSADVMVNSVRTSCGCTAAKLPETPWRIAPGKSGPIEVDMNIAGKRGTIPKSVTVDTSAGMKYLTVQANIADPAVVGNVTNVMQRERNQMLAQADPLAIFKGECVKCHVEPTVGKMGKELYASACSICHNAEHRAAMVPDLQDKYRTPMPAQFWKLFIELGKPGTLMTTFAKEKGGILSPEQVDSLVDYLVKDFPKETRIVYHDPHGPSAAPLPVATPAQPKPVSQTNSPSAALPKIDGLPASVSVFPAPKTQ